MYYATMVRYLCAFLSIFLISVPTIASDHDDGELELKGRHLNLTDLYAFQEANQTGNGADAGNLILILNTNPRSLPGQEYYFSQIANYEFHLSRVLKKTALPTGSRDISIGFKFSSPDENNRQRIKMTIKRSINGNKERIRATKTKSGSPIYTTNLASSFNDSNTENIVKVKGQDVSVFAGHRQDPFFFDVEQFFKVRAELARSGGSNFIGFSSPDKARDFTKNYNVLSIVVRIPIALLQDNNEDVFDIWETISVAGRQIERLGRPAINEGLVLSNKNLNIFNKTKPENDLTSSELQPALGEALAVLGILANIGGQPASHVTNVVNGFLPDVMRIDTSKTIPPGTPGYVGDFVINDAGAPMLTGGRKIEDDVIDFTLTYLVFGTDGLLGNDPAKKVKDNVSYEGTPGNGSQGHRKLHGQANYNGPASFPFLARPE